MTKPTSIFKVGQWDFECSMISFFILVPIIFYSIISIVFLVQQLQASRTHPVEEVVDGKKKVKSHPWTYVAIVVLLFIIAFGTWHIIHPPKGEQCKNVIRGFVSVFILYLLMEWFP